MRLTTVRTADGTRAARVNGQTLTLLDDRCVRTVLDDPDWQARAGAATGPTVSLDEALTAAGVRGDFRPEAIPAALRLDRANVVRNGSTHAAQLVYRGARGPFFVFCQPRDHPLAFSGFPVEPTVLDDKPCYSVYCSRYRALSVSTKQATYTLVGRRGDPLLIQVLNALTSN